MFWPKFETDIHLPSFAKCIPLTQIALDLIIVDIIPGSAEFLEFMALDNVLNFYIFGTPKHDF